MTEPQDTHTEDSTEKSQPATKYLQFKRRKFIWLVIATIILTALITVFATIAISNFMSGLTSEQRKDVAKIEQAYKTIDNEYYKDVKSKELSDAAINGMVKQLDDPYSEYMTKQQTKAFNEDVSGDFVGIGAEMQKKMTKFK